MHVEYPYLFNLLDKEDMNLPIYLIRLKFAERPELKQFNKRMFIIILKLSFYENIHQYT